MKPFSRACGRFASVLGIIVVVSVLNWSMSPFAASAQQPAAQTPAPNSLQGTTQPPSAQSLEDWRQLMARSLPSSGCYTTSYPSTQWQDVPCTTAPKRPHLRPAGAPPAAGGGGSGDFLAIVTTGNISSATGLFDQVTGVTSESDPAGQNSFSLQLNPNYFITTLCANQQGCIGAQQFVYSNLGCPELGGSGTSCVFIQYWLLGHGNPCPTSPTIADNTWTFSPATGTAEQGCFINGNARAVNPNPTITELAQMRLTGVASPTAQSATIEIVPGKLDSTSDHGDFLGIGANWTAAEFNVVANCCTEQATFNPGSTIYVRTIVNNGTQNAPTCLQAGYTAESNNLNLIYGCETIGGASPAIMFTESYATSASKGAITTLVPVMNYLLN
jgi:hypothetical protein